MSDQNSTTDSGSPEAVALALCKLILASQITGGDHKIVYDKGNVLAVYAECRTAVSGTGYDLSKIT